MEYVIPSILEYIYRITNILLYAGYFKFNEIQLISFDYFENGTSFNALFI